LIFLLILLIYAFALGRISVPLTGDQKVYLSAALEMKEKGSFLIPYLYGVPNFLKPPFQYWMTMLGWQVFGLSLFGALIPSVLALVGAAVLVKKLSPGKNNLSALIFASTLATMTYGTTAQMEIWIVLFYLAAWFFYLEQKVALSFITVGVMAWIKGPLYPVLFVISVFFKSYLEKDFSEFRKAKFWGALFLGMIVGLLWYGLAAHTQYEALKSVFLGRENFGKIQTSQGTPFGLWLEFFATLFPILFIFVASVLDQNARERMRKEKVFWLSYALIPALFFTFFPYRVNTYLYLLTPVVAWMSVFSPNPSLWVKCCLRSLVILLSAFALVLTFRLSAGGWITVGLASVIGLCLIAWAFSNFRFQGMWVAVSSLILVNLIRMGATEIGEWDLKPLRDVSQSELAYRIESGHEDIWHEIGLVSSALGKVIERVKTPEEEKAFTTRGGVLILSDEQVPSSDLHCDPWRRLKRRMKFPLKPLLLSGLSRDDPDLHRTFQLCRLIK
jgi:4-amino-4-deoxy-L-arabinose transferase-like glycosyltransferase